MALEPGLEEQQLHGRHVSPGAVAAAGPRSVPRSSCSRSDSRSRRRRSGTIDPALRFRDRCPAALCVVVLALATRVRIDTPFGFTVPTQLAFVPLLFAVPVCDRADRGRRGAGARAVPDVSAARSVRAAAAHVGNAWFAIGPAAVFALAGRRARDAGAALLVVRAGGAVRRRLRRSALRFCDRPRRELSRPSCARRWVYVIDVALSGVALVVAEEITARPAAVSRSCRCSGFSRCSRASATSDREPARAQRRLPRHRAGARRRRRGR